MTNTVSHETGSRLAGAGFPQPAPEPGQWWGDERRLVFVWRERQEEVPETIYFTVTIFEDHYPYPDQYFDLYDFRGLVYLPTVGDILNAIPDYCIVFDDSQMPAGFTCYDTLRRIADQYPVTHKHHAEAAALAYLSIHEKSKT
jgi:hypothetical protein